MPKNTTQVIFECSYAFRRRLQQEKLKRRMSVKQMIMMALKEYWSSHDDEDTEGRPAWLLTLGCEPDLPPEKQHWADMFVKYIERCPPAKVQLLQRVIEEDLKVHRVHKTSKKKR
jgi:hypothetical protein